MVAIETYETKIRTIRYETRVVAGEIVEFDEPGEIVNEEAVILSGVGSDCEGCGDHLTIFVRSNIGGEIVIDECLGCFVTSAYVGKIELSGLAS